MRLGSEVIAHAGLSRSTNVGLRLQSLLVFALVAFILLLLLQGNLFVVTNDEGLTLERLTTRAGRAASIFGLLRALRSKVVLAPGGDLQLIGVSIWTASPWRDCGCRITRLTLCIRSHAGT